MLQLETFIPPPPTDTPIPWLAAFAVVFLVQYTEFAWSGADLDLSLAASYLRYSSRSFFYYDPESDAGVEAQLRERPRVDQQGDRARVVD